MKVNDTLTTTASTIARQMLGTPEGKTVTLICLEQEQDYFLKKKARVRSLSSFHKLPDHLDNLIYGINLWTQISKKQLIFLKKNLKPNSIIVSIQTSPHLTPAQIKQLRFYFPNTVVTQCSFLPDSLRPLEKTVLTIIPFMKRWCRYKIVRIQQHEPRDTHVRKKVTSKDSNVFDKDYFTNYYEPMTGAFSRQDLIRNKRWFYGWFRKLNSWYNFKKGDRKKVLEIGCSIGAAADILHDRGFDVTATDISRYAITHAKKLLPHLRFAVLDIDLPALEQNKYDLIYAFEVIEHLENPKRCLKNLYQMLKPGGVLICSTPYPYPYVYYDETHISVKYPHQWIQLFNICGFQQTQYMQAGFIPFLYRFSRFLHIILPFGVDTKYINSPVFLYGKK